MDLNNLVMQGRLVKDPETRMAGDKQSCQFNIAVNGFQKDSVSFFDCTAWGKTGEVISKYFKKGQQIAIVGSLVQDRWGKDGVKQSRVKINVNEAHFCGSAQNQAQGEKQAEKAAQDKFEDDIPF